MATLNTDGLKDAIKRAEQLKNMPIPELLNDAFIQRYTRFSSLQNIVDESGLEGTETTFQDDFSEFVRTHTDFDGFQDMINFAIGKHMQE